MRHGYILKPETISQTIDILCSNSASLFTVLYTLHYIYKTKYKTKNIDKTDQGRHRERHALLKMSLIHVPADIGINAMTYVTVQHSASKLFR
jgi:hypothetical protein